MDFGSLIAVILSVLGYVLLGVLLRVTGLLSADDAKPLNTLLLYVAMPALIFVTVRRETLNPALVMMPLVGWIIAIVGLGISWALARALKLKGPTAGAFILLATFGNTGYIGYPIASAMLGDPGLVRAIISDVFGNTAAVIVLGTLVAGHYGDHDEKVSVVKEVLTFPPFIALALALVLHSVPIPHPVTNWLDALGKLVVPMVMIAVGLTLKPKALAGHLPHASAAGLVKLVVLPVVALGVGALLLHDSASLRVAVLQAGVSSMMLTMIMGMRFKLDTDFIASGLLLTTAGAMVTIPLFQLLIH